MELSSFLSKLNAILQQFCSKNTCRERWLWCKLVHFSCFFTKKNIVTLAIIASQIKAIAQTQIQTAAVRFQVSLQQLTWLSLIRIWKIHNCNLFQWPAFEIVPQWKYSKYVQIIYIMLPPLGWPTVSGVKSCVHQVIVLSVYIHSFQTLVPVLITALMSCC